MKGNRLVYLCLMLHSYESYEIGKKLLGHIILGMESLKAICNTIKKKADAFDTMILSKHIVKELIGIVTPIYKKLR